MEHMTPAMAGAHERGADGDRNYQYERVQSVKQKITNALRE